MTRLTSIRTTAGALLAALMFALLLAMPAQAMQSGTPEAATPAAEATPSTDTGPKFVIRPVDGSDGDYFTLEAEAGTTNELTVVLGNADDEPLSLRTYANDAVPITNGGFSVASEEQEPIGTATWIDYSPETYDFEAGEGVERTFTVTIPEDADPGQYIAGLALQTAEPLEVEGTSLFKQVIRKTIAVFIIVPGPEEPAFELGQPEVATDGALDRIELPVDNIGNVYVKPEGELTLTNADGEVVMTAPVNMGSVYAGMTVPLSVAITTQLPDGDYTLNLELKDEASGVTASLQDVQVALSSEEEAPAQFAMTGEVSLAPDASDPSYADVSVEIMNNGDAVSKSEVLLDVMKDGELVETFALAPSLALPQGATSVEQRYIPPTGFEPGVWSFELRLNVIDPSTDATTNVAAVDDIPEIEVGE